MKKIIILFLLTIPTFAQPKYPIDTTYNVKSVCNKTKKEYPYINHTQSITYKIVNQKKEIVYKKIKSRKLHLDAYYNKVNTLNPAIIIIHGGGWRSGNKSQMEPFAIEMAPRGYSSFNIEFRLSLEAPYPAAIFDVKNAIQFVKKKAKQYNVDTAKVAVLGCSSGGQMATLIGTTNGKRILKTLKTMLNFPQKSMQQWI